jgi:hypothetical protein
MAQEIQKTETRANDPDKITVKPDEKVKPPLFTPTGKQLADLATAAKCHANVFKDGAGKEALDAIVKAALDSMPPAVPPRADGPGKCWRCKGEVFETVDTGATIIKRCIGCAAKYVTQRTP